MRALVYDVTGEPAARGMPSSIESIDETRHSVCALTLNCSAAAGITHRASASHNHAAAAAASQQAIPAASAAARREGEWLKIYCVWGN